MTMSRLLPVFALAALLAACAGPSTTVVREPAQPVETPVPEAVPDAVPDGRCNTCGVVERIERTAATPATEAKQDAASADDDGGIVSNVLAGDDAPPRTTGFAITVRLDSGEVVTINQRALAGVRQGMRVEIVEGRAQPVLEPETR